MDDDNLQFTIYNLQNIKEQLQLSLQKIIKELANEDVDPQVTISNDLEKGDFTSNISMRLGGKLDSPMQAGERIVEKLKEDEDFNSKFQKIEAVKPGFINFWLSKDLISENIVSMSKGLKPKEKNSSLMIEFGDLNPFKEPHIGHIRNFTLGESFARLHEYAGVKVTRANYEGDVGMHVAKAIYGIQSSKFKVESLNEKSLDEKINFLARAYAAGAKAYEESESKKEEIIEINNKIYQKDPEIEQIWQKGRQWSLDYFEELYKKLGVAYDKYYFESEVAGKGIEIVNEYPKVFVKDDGAFIFRGKDFGLHNRVFINSNGFPTYEAKELGLAMTKNNDFPEIDKSIIITANEQADYFKVLFCAIGKVDEEISKKSSHLSYGFVDLKEGKMSSRSGNVVGANWLLEETKKMLKKDFKQLNDDVLEDISIGAVKWSMLKFSRESNISFSIEESIDLTGNSGPYMQYTFARISSILEKSEYRENEANSVKSLEGEMLALSRQLCQFEMTAEEATRKFSPNILTEYLFHIAQKFNSFYEKEKIIGNPNEKEIVIILTAAKNTIGQGLNLLGISAPEKI